MSIVWPAIDHGYQDPEGYIDLDVYNTAGRVLSKAEKLVMVMLKDHADGVDLMLKAAAKVTEIRSRRQEPIRDIGNYLYYTFKNLLCEEWRKQKPSQQLDGEVVDTFVAMFTGDSLLEDDLAQTVEKRLLVEQIISQMDSWTCEIYELLGLGYTFEEIARGKGVPSNRIRSKFHKRMKRLAQRMQGGTMTTENESHSDFAADIEYVGVPNR